MSTHKRDPDDFNREVDAHIELERHALMNEGMTPAEAADAARKRFGNVTSTKERFYESRRAAWLDALRQDVRGGFRSMRRYPVASAVAVLSLAAGIGATTVTLTVRDAVFRSAPPLYRHPEQLSRVRLGHIDRPPHQSGHVPAALFTGWRDAIGPNIAGAATTNAPVEIRTEDRSASIAVRDVTPGIFELIGVAPAFGRTRIDADTSGAANILVLSAGAWERLFDRRTDVIGAAVWIDQRPYTVAAIMPERFWLTDMSSPIWRVRDFRSLPADEPLDVIVRRPAGVSAGHLDTQLQPALETFAAARPADSRRVRHRVLAIEGTPLGQQVSLALPYLLAACVLLTLIIACANAAILMIAQWTAREHEMAIRASIGAGRGRIIRSLVTESAVVAGSGGVLGVCAVLALYGWVVSRGGSQARLFNLTLAPATFAQTALITLTAGVLIGMLPALAATRRLQTNPLRSFAGSRVRQRSRSALVVLEVAVTVALLVVTSSMIDGYRRALSADAGFAMQSLIGLTVGNGKGIDVAATIDHIERLPGVDAVAAGTAIPYAASGPDIRVATDRQGSHAFQARQSHVSQGFFSTLGVPVLSGRAFVQSDTPSSVAIVNTSFASRMFGPVNAVGRRVWVAGMPHDIVGVVTNFTGNPGGRDYTQPEVFLPLSSEAPTAIHFVIKAAADPGPLVEPVRRHVRNAAPGIEVRRVFVLAHIRHIGAQEILVGTAPLFPLIVIGMLLTTAGIYGVLAFSIARRTREFAVRLALGATNRTIANLVARHAVLLVGIGTAIGVAVTFGLGRVVRAGGGAGTVFDPTLVAFSVPMLIVMVIGLTASWLPARRASKIDAALLLRVT